MTMTQTHTGFMSPVQRTSTRTKTHIRKLIHNDLITHEAVGIKSTLTQKYAANLV